MGIQDSTFKTAHVLDNEIIKASDFEFAFEQLIDNVSKSTQMMLESNQDFVINGKVLPNEGMSVKVSPIYGVCKYDGKPFGCTEEDDDIGHVFEGTENGRIDILEVQGSWETFDNQQRAFNDPDTDTQTYQYVDTKKLLRPVYRIKKGAEGGTVAPEVDTGWVKLAEVVVRPNAESIEASDIKNITADVAGLNNTGWTTQANITYNIGYISDVNERFREQHKADGTHKDNVINTDSLNIGIGAKQVNAGVLPIGGTVSIPTETIANTDTILSVITKAASMITTIYNAYLLFGGAYKFNGELNISAIADPDTKVLTNPLKLSAAGDGTATIKIGSSTILSVDANGKLSTNGYTATSPNHVVTKAVTDAIYTALNNLTQRVENIENTGDATLYSNGVISMGTDGRYNVDSVLILAASTENVTLVGIQTIDNVTPAQGDLVLIKNQTDPKQNGIYEVYTDSSWQRASDYNTPDKIKGKIYTVSGGDTNAGKMFYLPKQNFTDPDFGADDIAILEYMGNPKPMANRLIMRDANGRAQVGAPVAENDIARKAEITALYGNTCGLAPTFNGSVGVCTTFARSDHTHPQTLAYCWHDYVRADINLLQPYAHFVYVEEPGIKVSCVTEGPYYCYCNRITCSNASIDICIDDEFLDNVTDCTKLPFFVKDMYECGTVTSNGQKVPGLITGIFNGFVCNCYYCGSSYYAQIRIRNCLSCEINGFLKVNTRAKGVCCGCGTCSVVLDRGQCVTVKAYSCGTSRVCMVAGVCFWKTPYLGTGGLRFPVGQGVDYI